jgi:hypothetical protein
VSELETEARVSRGTAAAVLKTLREDDPAPATRRNAAPDSTHRPDTDEDKDAQP